MTGRLRLLAALALVLVAGSAVGCGVGFGSGDPGTEVLRQLRVHAEPNGGANVVFEVDYRQPYDAQLGVTCYLKQNGKRLGEVYNFQIAANQNGGAVGDVTPVPGSIEGGFAGPTPGHYTLVCATVQDENNKIETAFTYPFS